MLFENQRRQVVELCVQLSYKGYFAGTGGNLMQRVDATHVLVTPSALDYLSMSAADICVLRLDDLQQVDGERKPSVETAMHAGILKRRADVGCSLHTHQPVASACALMGDALLVPPSQAALLGPRIAAVAYRYSGTTALANKVAQAVTADTQAYLMKNHGVICLGRDSDHAVAVLDQLEAFCRAHLQQLISQQQAQQPARAAVLARLLASLGGSV